MPQFSRSTIFEACVALGRLLRYHGELEELLYRWELDRLADNRGGESIEGRCRALFRYVRDHQDACCAGELVSELVVRAALERMQNASIYSETDPAPQFTRSLERDGFTLTSDGMLRRSLPEMASFPAVDDEVHVLLNEYGLIVSKGHLDQAIDAHTRGNWAGANGQIRTFFESLFDEIGLRIDPQGFHHN